jgi:hypothetical protein
MRTNKILLVIIIILVPVYVILDRQLFYYGKHDFGCYNLLPFDFKPLFRSDFEGGFCIKDSYELTWIGKGVSYRSNMAVKVSKIITYGYNSKGLIALIEGIDNNKYYIECKKNIDPVSKVKIVSLVWGSDKFNESDLKEYKWIEIISKDNKTFLFELGRNYSRLVILGLIITLIYRVYKANKKVNK